MQTINKSINLALSAILILFVSFPAVQWVLGSWRDSPLDRQGPGFLFIACMVLLLHWRSQQPGRPVSPRLAQLVLFGSLLAYLLASLISINLAQTLTMIGMLSGLLLLASVPARTTLVIALLLVLAMPTISFLLGRVLQTLLSPGYAAGIVIKWPLAASIVLLLFARNRALIMLLITLPLTWISLSVMAGLSEPSALVYWTGNASLASLAALVLSGLCTVILIKTRAPVPK